MRTRNIFRYLIAIIIALGTTVNAMAQERNLKIYFNQYTEGATAPIMLVTDDNNAYDIPAGVTVSAEGVAWAKESRFFGGLTQGVNDRLLADYIRDGNGNYYKDEKGNIYKKESHLKLTFTNFPYEVNMIQWNKMNDLFSGFSWSDLIMNYNIATKCVPVSGNGFSSSEEHWAMNVFTHNASFSKKDIPWQDGETLNGLTSFEINEGYDAKIGIGRLTFIDLGKKELSNKCRTFIKAGWNGSTTNSNITDGDDSNWAFNVKFTLPEISAATYTYDKNKQVHLQPDEYVYVGEVDVHAVKGYITAHQGAVKPSYNPNPDQDAFHFEYYTKNTETNFVIRKMTGTISKATVAGDYPVIVKLMRGNREVCSTEYTVHVSKKAIPATSAELGIGFAEGKKGYDVTVGDENAQIKGFIVKNAKDANGNEIHVTPTEDASGYHFEYSESSNGEIITINPITGDITPKKEGDVQITVVLKDGNKIISNPYAYTLHVFAEHEGLEFRRINTYHYTTNSQNLSYWKASDANNTTDYDWKSNNLLSVNTSINGQHITGENINNWKQIASFSTDKSKNWRAICQEIAFDVYVPKYTKADATYSFGANVAIGTTNNGACNYGLEFYYLNQGSQITLDDAYDKFINRRWNTYETSDIAKTILRNGVHNYYSNIGDGDTYQRGTNNVDASNSYEHKSYTVYFAAMTFLWKDQSYPGDASFGFKGIPTYTYYTKVKYDKNDGTNTIVLEESDWHTTTSKTETFKLLQGAGNSVKNMTRTGYEFLGWSTDPNATTPEYELEDDFPIYDKEHGGGGWGPVTLYAVWRPNNYIVELRRSSTGSVDGYVYATYDQPMPSVDVEGNPVKAPNHKGYDFKGYYDEPQGQGVNTKYYNEDMSSNHVWDRTDKNYVFARWAAHKTTVNLDFQEGANGTTQITATYGQAMPTATAPSREGYVFDGYYSEANGQGTKYYEADMASANKWYIDERLLNPQVTEVTLYAKWTKVIFTVTLDADGGTLDYKEIKTWGTILEKNASSLVLQVEKNESKCTDIWCSNRINIKPGYKLLGWYTEPQTEEDAHHHPALHPGTLVYSVDPGNNFSYHFRAVSEEANPKYWNSEKKWVGTDDLTLYAHYEMIFEVENDVITFLDSEPKNCVSGEDLTAALDYAKNHGAKLINTLDMTHPNTGADGKEGEGIMKAFEDAKAEEGSIVSPNALVLFTDTWPKKRKTNAVTVKANSRNECQDLVVTDRYSMRIPVDFYAHKATYARDAGITDAETNQAQNSTWGTLCLPYPIKNNTNGVKFYWLESTANNYMEFEEFGANAIIPANTPVIYIRTEGISSKINIVETYVNIPENATYTPVTIDYANPKAGTYPLASASKTLDNWEFTGNLDIKVFYGKDYNGNPSLPEGFIPDEEEQEMNHYIYYFKKNNFTRLSAKSYMILYPYRAYFRQVNGAKNGAKISSYSILVVGEDGSTTDITNAVFGDGEGDGKIYDLNGIRVMQPVKGRLYIVNGQKKVYR